MGGRRNNNGFDARPLALLKLIKSKRETRWNPVSGTERAIIDNANGLRRVFNDNNDNMKYIENAVESAGWQLGMESLLFLAHHQMDSRLAVDIVISAAEYDTEVRTKTLDDVYDYCVGNDVPPEWAVPVIMNLNEKPEEHKLVINPKGIKL